MVQGDIGAECLLEKSHRTRNREQDPGWKIQEKGKSAAKRNTVTLINHDCGCDSGPMPYTNSRCHFRHVVQCRADVLDGEPFTGEASRVPSPKGKERTRYQPLPRSWGNPTEVAPARISNRGGGERGGLALRLLGVAVCSLYLQVKPGQPTLLLYPAAVYF